MNVQQGKELLTAVETFLATIDPFGAKVPALVKLRAAVALASRPASAVKSMPARCAQAVRSSSGKANHRKIEHAARIAEHAAWLKTGETVDAFARRVLAGFCAGTRTANVVTIEDCGEAYRARLDADAYRAKMERCACGHIASNHVADELENLLGCKYEGCDCDHFHYESASAEAA